MDEENRWSILGAQELPCVGQLAFCSFLVFLCCYDGVVGDEVVVVGV